MVTYDAATTSVTVPGLVNMHDHLRAFVPGSVASEGAPLGEAISAGNARQAVAGPAEYRALTALGAARQVVAGTTSVVDHVYPLHRPGLLEAVVAGHAAVGVRGYVALGIMTRGADGLTTSVADVVSLAERTADELLPREQLFLAPVSLRQNAPEDYAQAVRAADRLGLRLYTHISENRAEVDACLAEHGVRPIGLLDRAGFLRPGTVLVHGVELTDAEIDLLAERGVALVYCPTNHLRFAKGVARVVDLLDAGVPVTLGVDGMESLVHEMRQAVYAQGQAAGDPGALSSSAAFAMATATASGVLGLPGDGSGGDLVRLDVGAPAWQPLVDPLWSLVHRASPAHVTDVHVAGRPILRDGVLLSADVAELAAEAASAIRTLAERTGSRPSSGVDTLPRVAPPQ
ncbi:amidohydrolase [Beutenbergia cavernae DSM 12333]|uniref:Amidohydrolase n=1 Tax=Beutenbergia cavernae (strain ATCC BAA-8 / DSM 12333 / CCUG 43141 / JCM 11478 / NBRC 16432 / NCIMB 13614 / HKI 0122) TaxID=471853 RepID=C5C422_BEUC1|nr:amidohydrolase family protein [Beutenbergia cavernae]ACQ79935.1 amidohydrolase [Beutenbergia cavernae DSM 12333]